MSEYDPQRRRLLQLLATAPFALALGCDLDRDKQTPGTLKLSPEASLRKLIGYLGPWPVEEKGNAEDFASRFVNSELAMGTYPPDSGELIQRLASRFPDGALAAETVDLSRLPAGERKLLIALVQQIYSLLEVRFLVSGEPPFGQCLGDRTRHTKPPSG